MKLPYLALFAIFLAVAQVHSVKHTTRKPKPGNAKTHDRALRRRRRQCEYEAPLETTQECADNDNDLRVCASPRGNGPRFFAHGPMLAKAVEDFGPLDGIVAGSSGTISAFMFESIRLNPLVRNCGNDCCSEEEQRARMSFLLKSTEAVPFESIIDPIELIELFYGQIEEILPRLQSTNTTVQNAAMQDVLGLLTSPGRAVANSIKDDLEELFLHTPGIVLDDLVRFFKTVGDILVSIINPELIELLLTSPNPIFHAIDVFSAASRGFVVGDDVNAFIRPSILNFDAVADIADYPASFYAGYEPIDLDAMESLLQDCAVPSLGLDWPTIQSLPTSDGETCGGVFSDIYQQFIFKRDTTEHHTRIDEPVGGTVATLIVTSVMQGDAVGIFEAASQSYFNANVPVSFNVDFSDVRFGYMGDEASLEAVSEQLKNEFNDAKSAKFLSLGPVTWRQAFLTSPAEPTLSRGVFIDDNTVSLGGWADPVPSQVLRTMGCDRVVPINRHGGVGDFTRDIVRLLGASQEESDDLFSLEQPDSAFVQALEEADAIYCADWDSPGPLDIPALAQEGFLAPLLTDDQCILSLGVDAVDHNTGGLLGCSP